MNKVLFGSFSLLVILLSACTSPPTDPYSMVAYGNAAIQATRAAEYAYEMRSTQEAAQLFMRQTAEAAEVENQYKLAAQQLALEQIRSQSTQSALTTEIAATQYAQATATSYTITATPLAATQQAVVLAAVRDANRAEWDRYIAPVQAIAPTIFWTILLFVVVILMIASYRRFAPAVEDRVRSIPRGSDGTPIYVGRNGARIIDPTRMLGPALRFDENGNAHNTGIAPSLPAQVKITSQAQAADVVRAMPRDPRQRKEAQKTINLIGLGQQDQPALLPAPKIEVLGSGQVGQVDGWIGEVEHQLLDDGGEL